MTCGTQRNQPLGIRAFRYDSNFPDNFGDVGTGRYSEVHKLTSPSGQVAVLYNRQGGNQDNLIVTFDSAASPALAALINQPAQGNWVLRVTDLAAVDVGKLNKWSLELTLG